ncbi:GNAT family N-acetyltransferase [Massilia niastensis]|uniref:GNAT family N-acetyltransferase n=1 Tax=Massilia niastensis TaxID=544911 RepID=UPI000382E4CB|nr:GNAT family N-acetyltransferase [Massilia niastensis]
MSNWQFKPVAFKFQLSSYMTLFKLSLPLQIRGDKLVNETVPVALPVVPSDELVPGSQGFVIRGLPLSAPLPMLSRNGDYLCYAQEHYHHFHIDFSIGYEQYKNKFSSKTRSTLNRKLRKYAEHCGGTIPWKAYRTPEEIREFFALARDLSKTTYQDRVLGVGLPDNEAFIENALKLAEADRLRAFILFDGARPVSYLYCPVDAGVLTFAYLGYDPEYLHLSVGIVLQWLATEQLFAENRFRFFDFTEGEGDHKRLFATHQRLCCHLVLVKRSLRNSAIIRAHILMNQVTGEIGDLMEKHGVKARVKRMIKRRR